MKLAPAAQPLPGLGAPLQHRPPAQQFAFDPDVEAVISEIVAETGYSRGFVRDELFAFGEGLLAAEGGAR